MTVVMVHADAGMGGPARTLATLAEYVAAKHDVIVAAPDGFVSDSVRQFAGVRTVLLSARRDGSASRVAGLRRILELGSSIGGPALYHANGLSALNLLAPAAIRARVPCVVHFHSSRLASRSNVYVRAWRRLGLKVWFAPVSEVAGDLLRRKRQSDRITSLLGNPVTFSGRYLPPRAPHDPFRVGWMGSAKPAKGLHRVAEIMDLTRSPSIEWRLYGVGDRGFVQPYAAQVHERMERLGLGQQVKWCGWMSDPAQAYEEMDCLLITSAHESFCRVAVEAMALRVPVVAGRIPALAALISDGENGFTFDLREPAHAVRAIDILSSDRQTWNRIAEAGVATAAQFSPHEVALVAERIYSSVLNAPSFTTKAMKTQMPLE